ncbi:NADP-dependent oxidoreductase [Achromobacter deleyi]|uniref:NADP-dependent oxidoreductase n=1 Tax=Achromobacter deleyi TaxID=1353891 RepID=UPI0014921763|nr:NADP-dependent oxidoreductase [Achromobacter deleyi]QVQ27697.1 NADP-dependent oxidoreductase [Achromobacter deleyi]UIP23296.1 NADP-dependent oxidoreductase [Achromobacter deleyi]
MSETQNLRVVLASRPIGRPKTSDFRFEHAPIPQPGDGQLLLETQYLSLDPYMRWRISDAKSYAPPIGIGEVIVGGTVARVKTSRHPDWREGDIVLAESGWQQYALSDGSNLRRLDPAIAPPSTALGVLGMPGFTAYGGLLEIGQPKPGETVVVAAASGAVGSVVGQIARIKGARAVGIAGGPEKCAFVKNELGFDAVVDHQAPDFAQKLAEACPDGIDVYFENVSGHVWDAVLPLLNDFARVPVCGLIANYNDGPEGGNGPDRLPRTMREILARSITLRGFLVYNFTAARHDEFQREAAGWINEGKLLWREDVVEGLERAPEAFIGLLEGRNFGKLVVRLAK